MPAKVNLSKHRSKAKTKIDYTSPARLQKIFTALDALFPQAECALRHDNPFQLLVATILSAQCTDERVNKVTPELFRKFPAPQDYVGLPQEDLEREIHSTGFFRNKAKSIIGAAAKIVHDFRITRRLKLSKQKTPEKVEQDLMRLVPQTRWVTFSHQLIWFGRKICFARNPHCAECPLVSLCDSPDKTI